MRKIIGIICLFLLIVVVLTSIGLIAGWVPVIVIVVYILLICGTIWGFEDFY